MTRTIIHLNLVNFAVAVERLIDQRLRDRPVIVAPQGASRAAVYDMSEEAYVQGVRKGMPLLRACRLCRDAKLLPPHPDRYDRASQEVYTRALPYSPLVEATDASGHVFLDTTGTSRLHGPAQDVAFRLQRTVRADLGLEMVWAVASNRLVAKVATRVAKPQGECIVREGEEEAFLRPLPVNILPGLERTDLQTLMEFRLQQVGQLAAWTYPQLTVVFGRRARELHELARGIDSSPVLPAGMKPPVVTARSEIPNGTNDVAVMDAVLYGVAEQAGADLRRRKLVTRRVNLTLDYADGIRGARAAAPPQATANDVVLYETSQAALARVWTRRVAVRHLSLVCDQVGFPSGQLELPFGVNTPTQRQERLITAIDRIRSLYGTSAIKVGRTLS